MGRFPRRRACISGVGQTRYTRWGGTTDASEQMGPVATTPG